MLCRLQVAPLFLLAALVVQLVQTTGCGLAEFEGIEGIGQLERPSDGLIHGYDNWIANLSPSSAQIAWCREGFEVGLPPPQIDWIAPRTLIVEERWLVDVQQQTVFTLRYPRPRQLSCGGRDRYEFSPAGTQVAVIDGQRLWFGPSRGSPMVVPLPRAMAEDPAVPPREEPDSIQQLVWPRFLSEEQLFLYWQPHPMTGVPVQPRSCAAFHLPTASFEVYPPEDPRCRDQDLGSKMIEGYGVLHELRITPTALTFDVEKPSFYRHDWADQQTVRGPDGSLWISSSSPFRTWSYGPHHRAYCTYAVTSIGVFDPCPRVPDFDQQPYRLYYWPRGTAQLELMAEGLPYGTFPSPDGALLVWPEGRCLCSTDGRKDEPSCVRLPEPWRDPSRPMAGRTDSSSSHTPPVSRSSVLLTWAASDQSPSTFSR
jgi:hypothetical protein